MKILEYLKKLFEPKFLSEEEIIRDLLSQISEDEKNELINTPFTSLIKFHSGGGRHIRNKYHLWHHKNPYTQYDPEDLSDPNHPDNMSIRIIQRIWKRLQVAPPNTLIA